MNAAAMARRSASVRLTGLEKRFGDVRAVDGVDLEVPAGSVGVLLGPSGCGKTTTLRLIAGLERPDAGEIFVGGTQLDGPGVHVPADRRGIGIVFQDYALFPHLDVAGNVGYALGRRPDPEKVQDALDLVGLGSAGSRSVHELSGGQQQRVALARALAPTPGLVLLDEPFSNLDARLRERVSQDVRRILKEAGVTALFVTHDQAEALSIADVVAVMHEGRIEQAGTPEEVYTRPVSRRVASFLGDIEILTGTASAGRVECELGTLPVPPGSGELNGDVEVLIRPEAIAIEGAATDGVTAEVVGRSYYGHDQLVELRLSSGKLLRSRRVGHGAWEPGDRVSLRLDGPIDVLPATRN
jgi:iron(III) transport system ATP-binding protein